MSSLLFGGTLELLGGVNGPYNVLDETGSFGDPQAVTQTVNAELTQGSAVTGDFTDNRACSFQVMISADTKQALAVADSALRAMVNQSAPNVLRWAPDGGLPVFYDTFRGQVSTPVASGAADAAFVLIVTISFPALPFARSTTQRMITGSTTSVQLGNFAQTSEYAYSTPNIADTTVYGTDGVFVPCPLPGTVYSESPSPPPVDGGGCMQLSLGGFYRSPGVTATLAKVGPVTGAWDLSATTNLTVAIATLDAPGDMTVEIRLTDASAASQVFTTTVVFVPRFATGVWAYGTFDLSAATIDLTSIQSWTLWLGTDNWNTTPTLYYYLGMLRAYGTLAALASTANGALYKLAGVLGDAQAPASIEFDLGGVRTISGCLAYCGPSWASINTPSLVGVVSEHATTQAPSPFAGTYHVIAADTASIEGGRVMTVTQYNGATAVATVTLLSSVVAGGTRWGDFGDLTLPLIDIPSQASNTTYDFAVTGTDVILADTRGFLVWVPSMTPAPYVWIDEATANGAGGVFAGTMPDRSDATSLMGAIGFEPSGSMSVNPPDTYLLVYCLDGAPSKVTVAYFDRYLGQRTAA